MINKSEMVALVNELESVFVRIDKFVEIPFVENCFQAEEIATRSKELETAVRKIQNALISLAKEAPDDFCEFSTSFLDKRKEVVKNLFFAFAETIAFPSKICQFRENASQVQKDFIFAVINRHFKDEVFVPASDKEWVLDVVEEFYLFYFFLNEEQIRQIPDLNKLFLRLLQEGKVCLKENGYYNYCFDLEKTGRNGSKCEVINKELVGKNDGLVKIALIDYFTDCLEPQESILQNFNVREFACSSMVCFPLSLKILDLKKDVVLAWLFEELVNGKKEERYDGYYEALVSLLNLVLLGLKLGLLTRNDMENAFAPYRKEIGQKIKPFNLRPYSWQLIELVKFMPFELAKDLLKIDTPIYCASLLHYWALENRAILNASADLLHWFSGLFVSLGDKNEQRIVGYNKNLVRANFNYCLMMKIVFNVDLKGFIFEQQEIVACEHTQEKLRRWAKGHKFLPFDLLTFKEKLQLFLMFKESDFEEQNALKKALLKAF